MKAKIAVLGGDGIGAEICDAAQCVLDAVALRFGHTIEYTHGLIGGIALDKTGVPLPQETIDMCKNSDAILLGAVGGSEWDAAEGHFNPERGLSSLRSQLGLHTNIRPVNARTLFYAQSPLKPELLKKGVDMLFVRDISAGLYNGEHGFRQGKNGEECYDTGSYCKQEIERTARLAFEIAASRKKELVSLGKGSCLEAIRLWNSEVSKIAKDYPSVAFRLVSIEEMLELLAYEISSLDVVLAPNMYGDIMSYLAATLTASTNMLPSSTVGSATLAMYQALTKPYNELAGKDIANPVGAILSASMMLATTFGLATETATIDHALQKILEKGYRTPIMGNGKTVSCSKFAELVALEIVK